MGLRFDGAFPDIIHSYLFFFGVWEPVLTGYMQQILRPGDIVIDVGANVGAHTLLASRLVGPTGRVHAIEASPSIFQMLEKNVRINQAANVSTYNAAVSDSAGSVTVYLNRRSNLGGTTILRTEADQRSAGAEAVVPSCPLQDLVPADDIRAARLIKIDVEGAEWLVVKGMQKLLGELAQDAIIVAELTRSGLDAFGASPKDFLAVLADAGFAPYEIANEYPAEFYVDPPEVELRPLGRQSRNDGDLVFKRT